MACHTFCKVTAIVITALYLLSSGTGIIQGTQDTGIALTSADKDAQKGTQAVFVGMFAFEALLFASLLFEWQIPLLICSIVLGIFLASTLIACTFISTFLKSISKDLPQSGGVKITTDILYAAIGIAVVLLSLQFGCTLNVYSSVKQKKKELSSEVQRIV